MFSLVFSFVMCFVCVEVNHFDRSVEIDSVWRGYSDTEPQWPVQGGEGIRY